MGGVSAENYPTFGPSIAAPGREHKWPRSQDVDTILWVLHIIWKTIDHTGKQQSKRD